MIKQPSKLTPHTFSIFLPSSTKKNFMTKCGQIVAKYYPNLAKFGHTDLSGPWNSLSFIQDPSNSIKSTFLYANFLTITYGPSERRVLGCFVVFQSILQRYEWSNSNSFCIIIIFWNFNMKHESVLRTATFIFHFYDMDRKIDALFCTFST